MSKRYFVFGAHSRGQTTAVYLTKLHPEWGFQGYLYDNDEDNLKEIDGFPVQKIEGDMSFAGDEVIYIGTRGVYHEVVADRLRARGAREIIPVDVELDNKLRNEFVRLYFDERKRAFVRIEEVLNECGSTLSNADHSAGAGDDTMSPTLYVVRSAVDSPLHAQSPLGLYETYIQAGRALSDRAIDECSCFDDTGENISLLNRQFCELTGIYWAWKNDDSDIVGIEHYRRRFLLPDCWKSVFETGAADVILPVPLYVWPSIEGNYLARHAEKPWETMMEILRDRDRICYSTAKDFFENTGCYSPCNMLIARREVFDGLCRWLFDILFRVKDICGDLEDAYQNRYFGFLSERLITFYFYWKADEIKTIYADKSFLK